MIVAIKHFRRRVSATTAAYSLRMGLWKPRSSSQSLLPFPPLAPFVITLTAIARARRVVSDEAATPLLKSHGVRPTTA